MERSTSMARHSRRVLVDHVQELEHPPVGGLVELEVEGPHHVGPDRAHGADGDADAPERLLASCVGHTQAFVSPQAVDPLVVDPPAGLSGRRGRPAPAPAGPAAGEVPQERPQGQLVVGRAPAGRGAGWSGAGRRPRQARRSETPNCSRRATTARRRRSGVRSFPGSAPSACRCRGPGRPRSSSGAGSPSRSSFSRLASSAFMPPYWLRQRCQVDSVISRWRHDLLEGLALRRGASRPRPASG